MAGLVGRQPGTKQPWRRLAKGQEEQEGPGEKDGGKESIQIIQFCLEELGEKGCNYSNFCKYVKLPVEPVFCRVYQAPAPLPSPPSYPGLQCLPLAAACMLPVTRSSTSTSSPGWSVSYIGIIGLETGRQAGNAMLNTETKYFKAFSLFFACTEEIYIFFQVVILYGPLYLALLSSRLVNRQSTMECFLLSHFRCTSLTCNTEYKFKEKSGKSAQNGKCVH